MHRGRDRVSIVQESGAASISREADHGPIVSKAFDILENPFVLLGLPPAATFRRHRAR